MTLDEMKLARDGWLFWGRHDQPQWPYVRPLFAFVGYTADGNVLTTDGGVGTLEWSGARLAQDVEGKGS